MSDAVDRVFDIAMQADLDSPQDADFENLYTHIAEVINSYPLRAKFYRRFRELNNPELKEHIMEAFNFAVSLAEGEDVNENTHIDISKIVLERGGFALLVAGGLGLLAGAVVGAAVALGAGVYIAATSYKKYVEEKEKSAKRKVLITNLKSMTDILRKNM